MSIQPTAAPGTSTGDCTRGHRDYLGYRLTLLPRPDVVAGRRRSQVVAGRRGSWPDGYRVTALAGDGAAAVIGCLCGQAVALGVGFPAGYALFSAVLPALWLGALAAAGAYRIDVLCVGFEERRRVPAAGAILVALVATTSYLSGAGLPRECLALIAVGAVLCSLGVRAWLRGRLHRSRRRGRNVARVLVVGHAERAVTAISTLDAAVECGFVAVGACLPTDGRRVTPATGVPLAADAEPILEMAGDLAVDAVVLVTDLDVSGMAVRHLVRELAARRLPLYVASTTQQAAWLPGARAVVSPRDLELVRVEHRVEQRVEHRVAA